MALTLTPDDIKRLQEKELANAIRKLQEGKTLTGAERALIAQAGVGGSASADGGFAATWDELADRLGVTRRAIQEWRKDPRYKADCPPDRADGRKEVVAWAAFIQRHGLKNADQHAPFVGDDDGGGTIILPPRIGGSQADWKSREIKLKGDRLEIELEEKKLTLLPSAELEIPLGATFVAIANKLTIYPERVAPRVTGLRDVNEVMDVLREECQSDLNGLFAAQFLTQLAAIVAGLPADPDIAAQFQRVTFAGQDVAALLAVIEHCAGKVLAGIGENAITAALRPALTHPVTGQTVDPEESKSPLQSVSQESAETPVSVATPAAEAKQPSGPPARPKRIAADDTRAKEIPAAKKKNRSPSKSNSGSPKVRHRPFPKPKPKPLKKK